MLDCQTFNHYVKLCLLVLLSQLHFLATLARHSPCCDLIMRVCNDLVRGLSNRSY